MSLDDDHAGWDAGFGARVRDGVGVEGVPSTTSEPLAAQESGSSRVDRHHASAPASAPPLSSRFFGVDELGHVITWREVLQCELRIGALGDQRHRRRSISDPLARTGDLRAGQRLRLARAVPQRSRRHRSSLNVPRALPTPRAPRPARPPDHRRSDGGRERRQRAVMPGLPPAGLCDGRATRRTAPPRRNTAVRTADLESAHGTRRASFVSVGE